jgi:predicted ATP-grasp superfamily ATP-dependent carboligase
MGTDTIITILVASCGFLGFLVRQARYFGRIEAENAAKHAACEERLNRLEKYDPAVIVEKLRSLTEELDKVREWKHGEASRYSEAIAAAHMEAVKAADGVARIDRWMEELRRS